MTTITIKVNKRTKAGKAFLAMADAFLKNQKGIEVIEEPEKSPYNPAFVKMVKKADKSGKSITVNPNNLWQSLGLK